MSTKKKGISKFLVKGQWDIFRYRIFCIANAKEQLNNWTFHKTMKASLLLSKETFHCVAVTYETAHLNVQYGQKKRYINRRKYVPKWLSSEELVKNGRLPSVYFVAGWKQI